MDLAFVALACLVVGYILGRREQITVNLNSFTVEDDDADYWGKGKS